MPDAKYFREELQQTAERLKTRGFELNIDEIQALEEQRKSIQVKTEQLQAERNSRSKAIGKAKQAGEDIQPLLDAVSDLGSQLDAAKEELREVQDKLGALIMGVPNLPAEGVPRVKMNRKIKKSACGVSLRNWILNPKIMLNWLKPWQKVWILKPQLN